jgi:NAD(P)-dependent dehydrogenase (short-subunit alcohol dehydrogenase family)
MKDQVVFITGGAMGMGEAVAILAAERGAKVVVADIDESAAKITAEKIIAAGGEASAVKCNVSIAQDVEAAIDFTVKTYGRLERGRKVLETLTGTPQAKPAPGFGVFAPRLDAFLKEHLFADVFESDVLSPSAKGACHRIDAWTSSIKNPAIIH